MAISVALRRRVGASLAAVALLLLAACGGADDSPTVGSDKPVTTVEGASATVLSATVRGGSVVDGAARQRATLNQPVTVRVTSDAADEVHVHGYDKHFDVAAGKTAEVTFVASIPGVFEVEFEKSKKVLFTMEVR